MGKITKVNEQSENVIQIKGRTNLISGAVYHNFEESPIFKGTYKGQCMGKDDEGNPKVIGFYFENTDGEEEVVTNAFAIEKALNTVTDQGMVMDLGKVLEITFKGKVINSKGKPFNRFDIVLLG
jgi:hypothetical protein